MELRLYNFFPSEKSVGSVVDPGYNNNPKSVHWPKLDSHFFDSFHTNLRDTHCLYMDQAKLAIIQGNSAGIVNATGIDIDMAEWLSSDEHGKCLHLKVYIGRTIAGNIQTITVKTFNSSRTLVSIFDSEKTLYRGNSYELLIPRFGESSYNGLAVGSHIDIPFLVCINQSPTPLEYNYLRITKKNGGMIDLQLVNVGDTTSTINNDALVYTMWDEGQINFEFINYQGYQLLNMLVGQLQGYTDTAVGAVSTETEQALNQMQEQVDNVLVNASQNFISR